MNENIESVDQYVPLTAMEDAKTTIVSDLIGGTQAAVVDFGTSVWNSLTPESMEVDTRDMVARVSGNALKVYDEHPDAVHAASFIGGMFVPFGLALKGANAARTGMKGVNWFSQAGKTEQMGKINTLIQEGKFATTEYQNATRALFMRDAANVVADNAIAELAIITTMNAHPFMEDYMKDPVHNFGVSMMLGTALVAPFSHAAARMDVKKLGMAAYTTATEEVYSLGKVIEQTQDYSVQLSQHKANIDNWSTILKPVPGQTTEYSTLTKQLAESFIQTSKAAQVDIFEKMASKDIIGLPNELKQGLLDKIASDPAAFAGINKISFASAKEETNFMQNAFDSLVKTTENVTGIPLTKKKIVDGVEETVNSNMVYSPTFGAFFKAGDLKGYGVAADLVSNEKALTKGWDKHWYRTPNYDADFAVLSETSAKIDLDYLRKLKLVDEMPEEQLAEMAIHPSDGATLNAVVSRLQRMADEGKDISAFKLTLTENKPNWNKIEEQMIAREIQRVEASGGQGVKADYMKQLDVITNDWNKYNLLAGRNISSKARSMIEEWTYASKGRTPNDIKGMTRMRIAAEEEFRAKNSPYTQIISSAEDRALVRSIYDSPASKELRSRLMQIADGEGHVYVYRGMNNNAFGSSPIESFTLSLAKGAEFVKKEGGATKLYKVKVNDILGGIRDIAGSAGTHNSTEVMVMSHTRDVANKLPIAELKEALPKAFTDLKAFGINANDFKGIHKNNMKNMVANSYDDFIATNPLKAEATVEEIAAHQADAMQYIKAELDTYVQEVNDYAAIATANTANVNSSATVADLHAALVKTKTDDIKMMAGMGTPPEVISLRTNTPLKSVQEILVGREVSLTDRMYSNADQVGQYINVEKKSLMVGTTMNKIPVAEMRANIHKQLLDQTDSALKQTFLMQSESTTLQDLARFMFNKDNEIRIKMLKDSLASVVDPALGSRFLQSAEFALRDMGTAGTILSAIGKESSHLYNKYTSAIVKPISDRFSSIIKDPAGVVEFNTARELNASLKGYREFRAEEGMFYVQNQANPWKVLPSGEKIRNMIPAQWKGQDFIISTPSVVEAFDAMGKAGRELFAMNSTYRKILGQSSLNDNGFWMPAFNPRNKFISYVIDHVDGTTKLLHANSAAELISAERAFASTMTDRGIDTWKIVRKGEDQALYNKIQGRHDPMFMSVADITSLHGGSSAAAIVPTNTNVFSELANGYEHYIHRSVADHIELQYSDVIQSLDNLSTKARSAIQGQPINNIQKSLNQIDDAGLVAKNTLLGRSSLKDYVGWQDAQNGIQTSIEMTLQTINKALDPFLSSATSLIGKGAAKSEQEWSQLVDDMAQRGIPNPFAGMDDAVAKERFHVEKISMAPNMTARTVALSNNLAATMLLKVMELGQPLVNMLSLPILTSAAVQRTFQAEFMGSTLKPGFHLSTTRAMYEGVRYLGHPDYAKYKTIAKDLGILDPVVSEVSELLQMSRSFNPGIMQRTENILSYTKGKDISHLPLGDQLAAKFVDLTSRPAMRSEEIVREISFATGVSLAKKAYPGLSDSGVVTFARNFVDTAVGNYNPAQRPALFQGTMGTAMGLFQTYMVTLMQQIYRKAELRDYKALAKMTLMQSSIFGVKSLPGFNYVSEQIGEHFSDANIDLTTGTYRAVPEGAADVILYGLPSNLGPSVYSRGDIQPRININPGNVQNLAAVNILTQAFQTGGNLVGITKQLGDEGASMSFMEALSVQSVSRPIARMSELLTGHAVTRNGNEVAGPEEIYSVQGVTARVFATRGLRESKAREAQYLSSMYKTIDKEQRTEAMKMLKNHIRSGTLTPEIAERVNEKYMRTGSPSGWRSAVNNALIDTDSPGVSAVRNHLSPDSPLNMMVDDID